MAYGKFPTYPGPFKLTPPSLKRMKIVPIRGISPFSFKAPRVAGPRIIRKLRIRGF